MRYAAKGDLSVHRALTIAEIRAITEDFAQSAISQQVQALERGLGFDLLERKNRRSSLTPAGEHFYKKSLVLKKRSG